MAKIVTLFFGSDDHAENFISDHRRSYYMFVESVSEARLKRVMNYHRYKTARRPMEE